ncbi:hypothetical protein [Prochlorococcus marinus]|uniref:hypothetical protein n=1 Tax=Prochlorococcus marinus TaxID=1219 RepID=UPI00138A0738|nr:hypothetical protein [Prochlorococcus marinus]
MRAIAEQTFADPTPGIGVGNILNAPNAEPNKAEATAKPRVSLETVKAVPIAPTAPLITAVS